MIVLVGFIPTAVATRSLTDLVLLSRMDRYINSFVLPAGTISTIEHCGQSEGEQCGWSHI